MIEPIDTTKIRGQWIEEKTEQYDILGTNRVHTTTNFSTRDDTIKSIKLVADKLNEVIEHLNKLETKN